MAIPLTGDRLIPQILDVVRSAGAERIEMVDLSVRDVALVFGDVVLVIALLVLGRRNVPMSLGVSTGRLAARTTLGPFLRESETLRVSAKPGVLWESGSRLAGPMR